MSSYKVTEIAEIVDGKVIGTQSLVVKHLQYDSRRITNTSNTLFLAISGERHNGHVYIPTMYKKGVRAFLVNDKNFPFNEYTDATFVVVDATINALQKLVAHHRSLFHIPIVGITGSNGKTIVKEWLSACLSSKFKVVRSPKSFNSQIGVPLSVWNLSTDSQYGVFEAGISQMGEMEKISPVINATEGIITNIGDAHQENFSTVTGKLKEKLKLFDNCNTIYYCRDHEAIHQELVSNKKYNKKQLVSWSFKDEVANLYVKQSRNVKGYSDLKLVTKGVSDTIKFPFTDKASIENILQVINYLLNKGFSFSDLVNQVEKLPPVAMRLEQLKGINGSVIINDAYNSDINSLGIALDYLNQQSKENTVLILSDIQQSGFQSEELYRKVAEMVANAGVQHMIGIGTELESNKQLFPEASSEFYPSVSAFIDAAKWKTFKEKYILIKGARGFRFEQIVSILSEKNHTTQLEINLNHLTENLNYFRGLLSSKTKLMVMVKALAYGSGGIELANLLQHEKVDYLGVAFADEGVALRNSGISLPIMVMAPSAEDFVRIVENKLEPEIYSISILNKFIQVVDSLGILDYPVHIKIDTGMHRLGFVEQEIENLITILKSTKSVKVQSIFSHLAGSDDDQFNDFTLRQIELFLKAYGLISYELDIKPMRHIVNSAGIERFPQAHFEMVRLGIGLHGISSTKQNLTPVSTLKTHVVQVKVLQKNETVGYSRRGIINDKSKIAVIPIGYADGLDRRLGNGNGFVNIKGEKAYYVGSICMDMSMIDVTNIDCEEGEEVIVFGQTPTIIELAHKMGTIPYEVLTNVSERVKRIYIKD